MKIAIISDTHELHRKINPPDADLLIHAGDFTFNGELNPVRDFNAWLGEQKPRYQHGIVVIPGNHERTFDPGMREYDPNIRHEITNATLLIEESVTVAGLKIWGTPIQPWFHSWAFNRTRGGPIRRHWELIPADTDILVVHGPPRGFLDDARPRTIRSESLGCWDLADICGLLADKTRQRVSPKLIVFGHIHGSGGQGMLVGNTWLANAACLNEAYRVNNNGQVICTDCWNLCEACTVLEDPLARVCHVDQYCECGNPCCWWVQLEKGGNTDVDA